eukprot:m.44467 g.44467  ORF g.44467 m.44467 type:complete len:1327 (+) comp12331_c0_seq1:44-4024(+)
MSNPQPSESASASATLLRASHASADCDEGQTTRGGSRQATIGASGSLTGKMVKVCIICAVFDEYVGATRALRAAGGKLETLYSQPDKVPFEQCILGNAIYRVFSLPAMGQAQAVTQRVLEAEQPGWLFMTGICGGKRGEVSLGDLIIADYTFHVDLNEKRYMDGSRKGGMRGYAVPDRVIQTVDHFLRDVPAADIHVTTPRPMKSLTFRKDQFLEQLHAGPKTAKEVDAIFDEKPSLFEAATKQLQKVWTFNKDTKAWESCAWIELNTDTYQWQLTAPGRNYVKAKIAGVGKWPTPDPEIPRFHRGEVAVASGVRSDMPRVWHELELHLRKTIGVEMEGVGLYSAAYNSLHNCNFVMVKTVQDYADDAKDDTYRQYGCELAAAWVVAFIKRHGVATAHVLMSEPLPEVEMENLFAVAGNVLRMFYKSQGFARVQMLFKDRDSLAELDAVITHLDMKEHKNIPTSTGKRRFDDEYGETLAGSEAIAMPDLFSGGDIVRVLMYGRPGIGKSTLLKRTAHDWANGAIFQQFKLVFLIRLRDPSIESGIALPDILHHHFLASSAEITPADIDRLLRERGNDVLIMFDGYDEFHKRNSALEQLIVGAKTMQQYSKCRVIVTSRSSALSDMNDSMADVEGQQVDRFVEILGFSENSIYKFVDHYYEYFGSNGLSMEHSQSLKDFLREHDSVRGLAYVPLLLVILCTMWRYSKGKLASTYTGIFKQLRMHLITNAIGKKKLTNTSTGEKVWCYISQLAWDTIQKHQFKFSEDNIMSICKNDDAICNQIADIGVINRDTERGISGLVDQVYYFVHLTLHEFAAAWYLSEQPMETIMKFIDCLRQRSDGRSLDVVCRLCCGLLGPEKARDVIARLVSAATVKDYIDFRLQLLALQCQKESDCASMVLQPLFPDKSMLVSLYDVGFMSLEQSDMKLLAEAVRSCNIRKVCFSECPLVFSNFLSGVAKATHLQQIDICNCRLGNEDGEAFFHYLESNVTVTHAQLNKNLLGSQTFCALARALRSNQTLLSLNLEKNFLGYVDSKAASILDSLGALTHLYLNLNRLEDELGIALGKALETNTALTHLELYENKLGDPTGIALGKALKTNTALTHLGLNGNKLGMKAGLALGKALYINPSLEHLSLSRNSLGASVSAESAWYRALVKNTSLKWLDLEYNELGFHEGNELARALQINRTLENVYLGGNQLGGADGILSDEWRCIDAMPLRELSLNKNSLNDAACIMLCKHLRSNAYLREIDLSSNNFGDSCVDAVLDMLKKNSTLNRITLIWNKFSNTKVFDVAKYRVCFDSCIFEIQKCEQLDKEEYIPSSDEEDYEED